MYRKIILEKNDYAKNYNRDYNTKIKSISDEIFQTEKIFPAGYIPIGQYKRDSIQFSAIRDESKIIDSPINSEKFDSTWSELSDYEKIIASHLLYGYYTTYIFSGSMGSGKTSTATHVLEFIKKKYTSPNSAFIKISFDFNLGVLDDAESNGMLLVNRFSQELYDKLKVSIILHLKRQEKDVVYRFIKYIDSVDYENYQEFFDLTNMINQQLGWLDYSNKKRAEEFIKYIEIIENEKIKRIEMLMKFLRFLKTDLSENEFIIIFYDNIDVLEPAVQSKIFREYILPLNLIGQTKCLICLRRNTFLRSFDYRDVQFAHSYGFVHHHGHTVSEIISQRLTYWAKNLNNSQLFNKISPIYKEALVKRITFLRHEYFSKNSSVKDFVNAISGNCVRLGLYIAHRLLVNNIIKFDETESQRDRYKKALIVSLDDNKLLSNHEEVINLFSVNNEFSLLPLEILKLVKSAKSVERQLKIEDILNDNLFKKKWTNSEILSAIKILMFSRRALIFIDIPVSNNELNVNASIFLTEIGFSYLNWLIEDPVYIQECLMAVKWNSDDIPLTIDVQNESERLNGLVKCLKVAFEEDFNHNYTEGKELSTQLVTLPIIEKVVKYIYQINYHSSTYYLAIFDAIEDLTTHILFISKIQSSNLTSILDDLQKIIKRKKEI